MANNTNKYGLDNPHPLSTRKTELVWEGKYADFTMNIPVGNGKETIGKDQSTLEPLYLPHEMPTHHRIRAKKEGEPAELVKGRRPSDIVIAQNLRHYVTEWRDTDYAGVSDTTRKLLYHWFGRDHTIKNSEGEVIPFRYYFCQREAIETFIFLREARGLDTLSGIVSEFDGNNREIAALGIDPEEDRWSKYAFKVATGAGKTKIMSLAIVWSYFHALKESYSPMAKHFVVIAPNLTVFAWNEAITYLNDTVRKKGGGKELLLN